MIQDQAMLISLSVKQWTARKYDKKASVEIEQAHQAVSAGRFNKALLDKQALSALSQTVSSARDFHYTHTLAWSDNGDRLLVSKLFLPYRTRINLLIDQFGIHADQFERNYPSFVHSARTRLGTLYNPDDYPSVNDIRIKFRMQMHISPVPAANDFRVDVGKQDAERIRTEITESTTERIEIAMRDCWSKASKVVQKLHERLSDTDAVFRDSLVENIADVLAILPTMNLTGDKHLNELIDQMKTELIIPPQRLRDDAHLRSETAQKANEILAKFKLI